MGRPTRNPSSSSSVAAAASAKRKSAHLDGGADLQPPPAKVAKRAPITIRDIPAGHTLEPKQRTHDGSLWKKIEDRFCRAANLISAYRRPLPTDTGNGTYVEHEKSKHLWSQLKHLKPSDFRAICDAVQQATGHEWDDRDYQLEHLVQAAVDCDQDTKAGRFLKEALLLKLWNDLEHPPKSLLGQKPAVNPKDSNVTHYYQFRNADGSYNNISQPMLGAAGTPYARTVKPMTEQRGTLPDAGLLFDTLMARRVNQKHENKISSMLFYFASIIIHDIFRTNHGDYNISKTSSYLDLAPLYGSNAEEQRAMRTMNAGKIHPDCFSEKRLLGFPPGVGALLIMFNRFHNHVVDNLASINEGNRFPKPTVSATSVNGASRGHSRTTPDDLWKKYDEDLFQTGRLITVGLYVNIILYDYIRTILNLNRTDSDWVFDPRMDSEHVPCGTGNQVSAEFNLVYRWHSTLSEKDVEWTEKLYEIIMGDDYKTGLSERQLLEKMRKWEQKIPNDPRERKLENLPRDKDGRYDDDALVKILTEGIKDCAHSFGAQRVPEVLRSVEILGIQQARTWNLATLNEFRQHFGLKRYTKFEQINPDKEISDALKHLYDTPDNVELYPGLVIEQAKCSFLPGSGLMAGFSNTRGILSDATALARGDRFLTVDYTPKNLTNWGFTEASTDPLINHGHVAYKLFLVSFPQHFQYNSILAHYPFTIPEENLVIMEHLGTADTYSWDEPKFTPKEIEINSYDAATSILNNKRTFNVTWGRAMEFLMGPDVQSFMLAGDKKPNEESRKLMYTAIYVDQWKDVVRDFYRKTSKNLLTQNAYKLAGVKYIDAIRDFSNIAHVRFCASMFKIPLKTPSTDGIFTEYELYFILVAVFILVFFDLDKEHSFLIHRAAKQATEQLGALVEEQVKQVKSSNPFINLLHVFRPVATNGASTPPASSASTPPAEENGPTLEGYGYHMLERLCDATPHLSAKQLVWGHVMGTLGGMVPNQSQGFSEMLEYFLAGDGRRYWPRIVEAAGKPSDDREAQEELEMFVLEGTRIACASALFREVNSDEPVTIPDYMPSADKPAKPHDKTFKKGDKVFINLWTACHDPAKFPDPEDCKKRDDKSYPQFGYGPHKCLGFGMLKVAFVEMLRALARLPNLRPVDGPQGKVKKLPVDKKGYSRYLTEDWSSIFPFPVTMKICWDDESTYEYESNDADKRKGKGPARQSTLVAKELELAQKQADGDVCMDDA